MWTMEIDTSGLVAALSRAEDNLERVMPRWVKQSIDTIAATAKATRSFRDHSSILRNSIAAGEVTGSWRSETLAGEVAAGAPYAAVMEFGTKKKNYPIVPRHRKVLRWAVEGGFRFARRVIHPGITGRHFMRDALRGSLPDIVAECGAAATLALREAGFR